MTDSKQSICTRHPERQAIGTCFSCGKAVCEECALIEEGKTICPLCLDIKEPLETLVQKDVRITKRIVWVILAVLIAGIWAALWLRSIATALFLP